MAWEINYTDIAIKQLKKMNKSISRKVMDYMESKISPLENPRALGKGLSFNKSGLWRYRIDDLRIICHIQDESIHILVVNIGHRKDVYG